MSTCPLCHDDGGLLLWRGAHWRVVRALGPEVGDTPAWYRVIAQGHVVEWSDLDAAAQAHAMALVSTVERCLRQALAPTKINLAALGNVVPHLHWHVIARFDWDSRFPAPVWAAPQRAVDTPRLAALHAQLAACDAAIVQALHALAPQGGFA
ncbi:MAG: HIT family protein [Tepidimonas ignava]|uniref:Diadenosine tetraphosphate (Ap4A) HIT family hydrolase n=1 Tax=Tepidimonas ignava TaxID=114249 RepID=A0A4R3L9C7_9BURK|nr:HIT family protein [Tepidimonas ignava]TCS96289.1 diadenosine tetraphosphate (Ap4A) HIT family hydrolase [Tepidimonas ignava]TSE23634.1 HIT domain protein [Tepidimonas ignava]